jgi:hypothetical protein
MAERLSPFPKGLGSLTLLTIWEIWKERNARVFRHKLSLNLVILDKNKCEARLWVRAKLCDLMLGE